MLLIQSVVPVLSMRVGPPPGRIRLSVRVLCWLYCCLYGSVLAISAPPREDGPSLEQSTASFKVDDLDAGQRQRRTLSHAPHVSVNEASMSVSAAFPAYTGLSPSLQAWRDTHPGWVGNLKKVIGSSPKEGEDVIMPVCVEIFDNKTHRTKSVDLSGLRCPTFRCQAPPPSCPSPPTPTDIVDMDSFVPVSMYTSSLDVLTHRATVCPAHSPTAFPLISPWNGFQYTVAPLILRGRVFGLSSSPGSGCEPLGDALLEAWHVDPWGAYTTLQGLHSTPLFAAFQSSRLLSHPFMDTATVGYCRGAAMSEESGQYVFESVTPGVYGPPMHVDLRVSRPGYATLTTRLYLSSDPWLQYLRSEHDWPLTHDPRLITPQRIPSSRLAEFLTFSDIQLSENEGENEDDVDGAFAFVADFDIVLRKVAPSPLTSVTKGKRPSGNVEASKTPQFTTDGGQGGYDSPGGGRNGGLDGVWAVQSVGGMGGEDAERPVGVGQESRYGPNGRAMGLVRVESNGPSLSMTEVPHFRVWGSAGGMAVGMSIQRVDRREGQMLWASVVEGQSSWAEDVGHGVSEPATPPLSLIWSNGEVWTKLPAESVGYRYLRLSINETLPDATQTSTSASSSTSTSTQRVILHELAFFAGHAHQTREPLLPAVPLNGYATTCTSTASPFFPCTAAFDREITDKSRWESGDIPARGPILETPQDITLDLGVSRRLLPTALSLSCRYTGCPRSLVLSGSRDGISYETIYARGFMTMQDYAKAPASDDIREVFLPFSHMPPLGRAAGDRCGSCDMGPIFACRSNGRDATCADGFCSSEGLCAGLPLCPLGRYRPSSTTVQQNQAFAARTHQTPDSSTSQDDEYPEEEPDDAGCVACPGGRYGATVGLTDRECSGLCPAGVYCPPGSAGFEETPCGDASHYCPEGSEAPLGVPEGYYSLTATAQVNASEASSNRVAVRICEPGHFCIEGLRYPCPIGRYGARAGLGSMYCEGRCKAGTLCPLGTVTPLPCPRGHYCPDGQASWHCPAGTFGDVTGLDSVTCSGVCEVGHYCEPGAVSATNAPCPAGSYGASTGLGTSECSGPCPAGYFCPTGSSDPTARPCGSPKVYCPLGSAAPLPVAQGNYSLGGLPTTHIAQKVCEKGSYCEEGVRHLCPAGFFGDAVGLFKDPYTALAKCSGPCAKGHYCSPGSVTAQQRPCPAGRYGEREGLTDEACSGVCAPGHYCEEGSASQFQTKCPGGRFGNSSGLTSALCSGECEEGFYCPPGSLSPRQVECSGPSVYCPKGSGAPVPVPTGRYSLGGLADGTRGDAATCPPGHFCLDGVKQPCPAGRFGATSGLLYAECTGPCSPGHYCPPGSVRPTQRPCPAGRYGSSKGLTDVGCSGVCPAGHYCPEGSVFPNECGGDGFYCPEGSGDRLPVHLGFYSTGGRNATRSWQEPCEPGSFCMGGVRRPCPAGRFGRSDRLFSEDCDGPCSAGSYCPPGSVRPNERPCPAGTFGDREGLGTEECSGKCSSDMECRVGTAEQYAYRIQR